MQNETKRYYPKNNLASHILGYMDKEGNPVMGLEASLDKQLSGQEGEIKYEKDGNGVILENGTVSFKPSHDGDNVKLTIDTEIQHYIEEAIKEAYVKYQPKSITAIAADPQTMEILGMANLPDFNPNEYWKASPEGFMIIPLSLYMNQGQRLRLLPSLVPFRKACSIPTIFISRDPLTSPVR